MELPEEIESALCDFEDATKEMIRANIDFSCCQTRHNLRTAEAKCYMARENLEKVIVNALSKGMTI